MSNKDFIYYNIIAI